MQDPGMQDLGKQEDAKIWFEAYVVNISFCSGLAYVCLFSDKWIRELDEAG